MLKKGNIEGQITKERESEENEQVEIEKKTFRTHLKIFKICLIHGDENQTY
jgi:hypothetical protein